MNIYLCGLMTGSDGLRKERRKRRRGGRGW